MITLRVQTDHNTPIYPEMMIAELVDQFPQLMDPLQRDYGFFCLNCLLSGFETLEEGAKMHGVEGDEFTEMLTYLNNMILDQASFA